MNFFVLLLLFISSIAAYEKPLLVPDGLWQELIPHCLAENSPASKTLATLFTAKKRPSKNFAAMKKAGFALVAYNDRSHLSIFRHKKLHGYLIKIFLDDTPLPNVWANFVVRIQGSQFIQSAIQNNGFSELMVVPKKWLYPLPDGKSPHENNFLLLVQEIPLLSDKENRKKWGAPSLSPNLLRSFYTIVKEVGLCDSVYVTNAPFSKEGKIAFVDTEHFHKWPIPWRVFLKFLAPELQTLWTDLNN